MFLKMATNLNRVKFLLLYIKDKESYFLQGLELN